MTSTTIAPTASIEITDPRQRLAFIPQLFFTPQGDQLVATWLQVHSQYDGGFWRYFEVPRGISGRIKGWKEDCITRPTGYLVPPEGTYHITNPGNYFDAEVSADAAGIIATLMSLNSLIWQVYEMGEKMAKVCQGLVDRQDALKDYISIIDHPERDMILRAID
ncbi:antirestriction protein [Citrobacter braakii]|uniref:antirestriction protein n=1 Tax=Citrobacter braakii TaxID=57706 RepID=UPI0034E4FB48